MRNIGSLVHHAATMLPGRLTSRSTSQPSMAITGSPTGAGSHASMQLATLPTLANIRNCSVSTADKRTMVTRHLSTRLLQLHAQLLWRMCYRSWKTIPQLTVIPCLEFPLPVLRLPPVGVFGLPVQFILSTYLQSSQLFLDSAILMVCR